MPPECFWHVTRQYYYRCRGTSDRIWVQCAYLYYNIIIVEYARDVWKMNDFENDKRWTSSSVRDLWFPTSPPYVSYIVLIYYAIHLKLYAIIIFIHNRILQCTWHKSRFRQQCMRTFRDSLSNQWWPTTDVHNQVYTIQYYKISKIQKSLMLRRFIYFVTEIFKLTFFFNDDPPFLPSII